MLARIGIGEIIMITMVAFLIFGPKKLPEIGKSLGRTINEFKTASNEELEKEQEESKDGLEMEGKDVS